MYIGLVLIELLLCLLYSGTNSKRNKRIIWYVGCAMMWLTLGLRSSHTGGDTIQYVNKFVALQEHSWTEVPLLVKKDYGFYYLSKLIGTVCAEPTWYLLTISFLSCIGVWKIIDSNSKNPLLSLFFYITIGNFLFIMTGIRQAVAMSFCLLSVECIQKRQPGRFLLLIMLAISCHHSAMLFFPMYFIAVMKVNIRTILVDLVFIILVYFNFESFLELSNELLEYDYGVENVSNGMMFYMFLLIIVFLALLTKKVWIQSIKDTVIMNLGMISAFIWTLRLISRTAERPALYWLNAMPIVLTNSVISFSRMRTRRIILMAVIVVSLFFYYRRVADMSYAFFWQ